MILICATYRAIKETRARRRNKGRGEEEGERERETGNEITNVDDVSCVDDDLESIELTNCL